MTIKHKHSKKNTNIIYSKANLFDIANLRISDQNKGSNVLIPHVCNNVNAYGAGFALEIANRFPTAKANFHLLGNQSKLGHVQFITVKEDQKSKHQIIIANMIAQNGLIHHTNTRPLNYAALSTCMSTVRTYIKNFLKEDASNYLEIHCPKFGSGLAGGNWDFISELIIDIWTNTPIFVYTK